MTTLGTMKARIRSDLRVGTRFDDDLEPAIQTAIDAYRDERFRWAVSRSAMTFNTEADKEFYTKADAPAFERLVTIDSVWTTINTQPYPIRPLRSGEAEYVGNGNSTGQPIAYSWYEQDSLRLYPLPAAVYPMRILGQFVIAMPTTEAETGNPWMTKAERLIRSRAKAELALHRMRDRELADDMMTAADEALAQLRREASKQQGEGIVCPHW